MAKGKKKLDSKSYAQQKRHRRQWTTFMRMCRYGINNFTRNAWLTIAATAIMKPKNDIWPYSSDSGIPATASGRKRPIERRPCYQLFAPREVVDDASEGVSMVPSRRADFLSGIGPNPILALSSASARSEPDPVSSALNFCCSESPPSSPARSSACLRKTIAFAASPRRLCVSPRFVRTSAIRFRSPVSVQPICYGRR